MRMDQNLLSIHYPNCLSCNETDITEILLLANKASLPQKKKEQSSISAPLSHTL